MKTRGLPGMLAPMYQDAARGKSVLSATRRTCATQASCFSGIASMRVRPCSRMKPTQSRIHSTCCSIELIMLESTLGLPGPVIRNMLGKSATARPR